MHPLVADLRDRARGRLDPALWEFLHRGSGNGLSAAEAESSWQAYRLLPRSLRDVSRIGTATDLFGSFATPVGVAPTAYHRLVHDDGEIATAAGAARAGSPFVLSSRSTCRIEDVARAAAGPWWFQVYVTLERTVTEDLVGRAVDAGATALVLTADTPYVGHRGRPGGGRPTGLTDTLALANMAEHLTAEQRTDPWAHIEQDPSIGPETIAWIRCRSWSTAGSGTGMTCSRPSLSAPPLCSWAAPRSGPSPRTARPGSRRCWTP